LPTAVSSHTGFAAAWATSCIETMAQDMANNMQRAVVLGVLPALPTGITASDRDDGHLLAMALASEADYLVTGDRRTGPLQMRVVGRVRVTTPSTC